MTPSQDSYYPAMLLAVHAASEDMKYDATDRFMRDAICGCYGAERFFLLHHTLHDGRPQVSWNTIVRMFRPRSSALEKRRVTTLK